MYIPSDDYSKAIYLHKNGKSKEAVEILKKLTQSNPNDVYYKDTLAQILCESGRADEAVKIYRQFCNEKSNSLIRVDFAKALLESDNDLDYAISILESTKYADYLNSEIFRLLAKAYGKKGRRGLAFFMLAQEQMLLQNYQMAYNLLKNCIKIMDKKTEAPYIKKAEYLKTLIERQLRI
jgi:predicted Zn-dependent protease